MIPFIFALLVPLAAALWGLAVFGGQLSVWKHARIAALDRHSAEFTNCAVRLAADGRTPGAVLDCLEALNSLIGQKGSARVLIRALVAVEAEANRVTVRSKLAIELDGCETEVRADVEPVLKEAIRAAFLALTYSDYRWGVPARAMLAERRPSEINTKLAKQVGHEIALLPGRRLAVDHSMPQAA